MKSLSSLIMSRLNSATDAYNFDAIHQNSVEFVTQLVEREENKNEMADLLASLVTSILYLQARVGGVGESNMIDFAKANSLEMPKLEVSNAPLFASLPLDEPSAPEGLGKLEKSRAKGQLFRWLLGDVPLISTFNIKNTGRLKFSIHYLSFAQGVSFEDLEMKCNGILVPLIDKTEAKVLEGIFEAAKDFHSNIVTFSLSANNYQNSGGSGEAARKIVLSITSITVEAVENSVCEEQIEKRNS